MTRDTDIAVIGAGCRLPDAVRPQEFWRNIEEGVVSVRDVAEADLIAAGVTPEQLSAPGFVPRAARIRSAADFAAEFFGYARAEAETIDPQQRLFLEVCWEAMESAGHAPRTPGPLTGVFAGSHAGPYSARLLAAKASGDGWPAALGDVQLHLGGLGDFTAARVSYKLGLTGPAVGVQAACASALHAVHHAVRSLLADDCEIALAGGTTVLEPAMGYHRRPDGSLSDDGLTRSYDAASTGTAYSSGVGVVVLRRLADALSDGDTVLAVIRASTVGNHGAQRAGFTAPSAAGVASVVTRALRTAGLTGDRIGYVEGHGTGTPIGDRIEIRGLTAGFGTAAPAAGACALGSVKANIGHTGAASGIAALLNAVNVVRTGVVPPHPLFQSPREPASFARSPFSLSADRRRMPDGERFALVNAIGFGGTNAVAVLTGAPEPTRAPAPEADTIRLPLSARHRDELDELAHRLADVVEDGTARLGDLAHTLRVGRTPFAVRRVVTARGNGLAKALRDPGSPAVRTAEVVMPRSAVLVLGAGHTIPAGLNDRLHAAFGGRLARAETAEESPDDAFRLHWEEAVTEPGPRADDLLDELVHAAWLHGVPVDWQVLAGDRGRRVPLPTYPFRRDRYWALDHVPAPAS